MKVESWEDAKRQALLEAKKRLGARIEKYWVNSITLEPSTHGGLWNVKLDLQVRERWRKKLIKLAMKLSPETGEPIEFKIKE